MKRLQRYQNVSSFALAIRCGIGLRNDFTTKLKALIATVNASPMRNTGSELEMTEINAERINTTSEIIAARVVTPMRCLTTASRAGRNVIDAMIMSNTPITAPIASPRANASPIKNSPSNEMITVMPAKITARPEVLTASTTASSTLSPLSRPSL